MDHLAEGEGPPIFLLPGLGCDHRLWRPVGERLRHRFTVVYPATWGRGSLQAAASDLGELIGSIGQPPLALVGLSMGGYLAFELLRQSPLAVRAAAFADTTAYPDSPERASKRRQALRLLAEGRFPEVLEAFAGSVLSPSRSAQGPERDLILSMGLALGPAVFASDAEAILKRKAYEDVLVRLRIPALFLCGEHDTLTPPEVALRMAASVPGAQGEIIPDAGHLSPLENPDAVARVLEPFLQAAASRPAS